MSSSRCRQVLAIRLRAAKTVAAPWWRAGRVELQMESFAVVPSGRPPAADHRLVDERPRNGGSSSSDARELHR